MHFPRYNIALLALSGIHSQKKSLQCHSNFPSSDLLRNLTKSLLDGDLEIHLLVVSFRALVAILFPRSLGWSRVGRHG